jgi:hypothetical protein
MEAVMLKKLFYASASILMLAIAYHLGATTAAAQAPGNPVVATFSFAAYQGGQPAAIVTANGDIYYNASGVTYQPGWYRLGNVFTGPTPAAQPTFGQLKARYR